MILDQRPSHAGAAIAYLLVRGQSHEATNRQVRAVRPQAMPALELRRSLEHLEEQLTAG